MSSAVRPKPAATRAPIVSAEIRVAAAGRRGRRHPVARHQGHARLRGADDERDFTHRGRGAAGRAGCPSPAWGDGRVGTTGPTSPTRWGRWLPSLEADHVVADARRQLSPACRHRDAGPVGGDVVDAHALARELVALDGRRWGQGRHRERRDDQRQERVQPEGQNTGDHDRQRDREDGQWTQEAVSVDFRDGFFQRRPMPDSRDPASSGAPGRPGRREVTDLRSQRWFAPDDLRSFGHRSRLRQLGHSAERRRGQARHRDPQHLERPAAVPRALPRARRRRQAGRLAGGRLPGGDCRCCRCRRCSSSRRRCSTATCSRSRSRRSCDRTRSTAWC